MRCALHVRRTEQNRLDRLRIAFELARKHAKRLVVDGTRDSKRLQIGDETLDGFGDELGVVRQTGKRIS